MKKVIGVLRTKGIVPPSTKHGTKKIGAVGAMAPARLSFKTRGAGGLGGSHTRTGPAPPHPVPGYKGLPATTWVSMGARVPVLSPKDDTNLSHS